MCENLTPDEKKIASNRLRYETDQFIHALADDFHRDWYQPHKQEPACDKCICRAIAIADSQEKENLDAETDTATEL